MQLKRNFMGQPRAKLHRHRHCTQLDWIHIQTFLHVKLKVTSSVLRHKVGTQSRPNVVDSETGKHEGS